MKKTNFLVTGGYGFIGSSLIRKLLSNDHSVINIDKLTYSSNINSLENLGDKKNYTFYQEDICNGKPILNIFEKHRPLSIIHLAAETHVDRSIDGPENFIHSNILGTYNILNASFLFWKTLNDKEKNDFRLILVSTDEVYGSLSNDDIPTDENSLYKPNSPYSASKAASDHLGRAWFKTYKLPVIITNTTNNYGPWQFPEKLIPLTISKCLEHEKIPVYGDGSQIRDWIYVEDHVSGILKVLEKGKLGDRYNIGANNEIKNINLVKLICSVLDKIKPMNDNRKYESLIEYVEDRPGHDHRYSLNNNKITSLGWEPEFTWQQGLEKTVKWYVENSKFLKKEVNKIYSGERLGRIT
tara:strand:- start:505 stop:1566 length:1062 start_codon:yes stop_codon:yes gene_type:complete